MAQNAQLDGLEKRLCAEKTDTIQLQLLKEMTDLAFDIDIQTALGYAKRGVARAEKLGNKDWQPKFYEMQGRMHANLGHLDSATVLFNKAVAGYQAVGNSKGQATTAFKIAWVHKHRNEIDKAMAADMMALRAMEKLGDQAGIANALGRISEDLVRQERPKEGLQYAQKALDICRKNGL